MDDCECGGDLEVDIQGVNIKNVILPNGDIKGNVFFPVESSINTEKTNCLTGTIYDPSLYVMMILGPQQATQVLDDQKTVKHYLKELAADIELEIRLRRTAEKGPKPINPGLFKINMKGSS